MYKQKKVALIFKLNLSVAIAMYCHWVNIKCMELHEALLVVCSITAIISNL